MLESDTFHGNGSVLQKVAQKRAHVQVWELIEDSSNEKNQSGVKSEFDP